MIHGGSLQPFLRIVEGGKYVRNKRKSGIKCSKVLSYRGKVRQAEIERIGKEMEDYIKNAGAKRVSNPITATYAVEDDEIDVELIMPIDMSIDSTDKFVFKDQIKIVNAVVAAYKGHPIGLQEACNHLNKYIVENKLQPITVGYNVTKKTDMLSLENTEIDVYVGISPNIL